MLFNTNGGSGIQSQKVRSAQKALKSDDPVRNGYIFGGWYTDKQLSEPYDFEKSVTRSFTLYAKWIKYESAADLPEWENPFCDVADDDWYCDDVKYVSMNGLISGMTQSIFAPDGLLTRGMLVAVLYRVEGEPFADKDAPFADVDENAYYAKAVGWAKQNGIISGVTETTLNMKDNATRAEIAAILQRFIKKNK